MASIDGTLTVAASPPEAFDFVTDPEKGPVWQSSLLEASFDPPGPLQRGTRITESRKLLGRRLESTVEVTELEPGRRFSGKVLSGPFPWEFTYAFEPTAEGTRIDFHIEGEPGGFFRLAEPIVVRTVRKQMEADFATLKELIEST